MLTLEQNLSCVVASLNCCAPFTHLPTRSFLAELEGHPSLVTSTTTVFLTL
jgi:hypothetical protein